MNIDTLQKVSDTSLKQEVICIICNKKLVVGSQFLANRSNRKFFQQTSKSQPSTGGPGQHKIYCRAGRHPEQLLTLLVRTFLVKPYLQTHIFIMQL